MMDKTLYFWVVILMLLVLLNTYYIGRLQENVKALQEAGDAERLR